MYYQNNVEAISKTLRQKDTGRGRPCHEDHPLYSYSVQKLIYPRSLALFEDGTGINRETHHPYNSPPGGGWGFGVHNRGYGGDGNGYHLDLRCAEKAKRTPSGLRKMRNGTCNGDGAGCGHLTLAGRFNGRETYNYHRLT